MNSGSQECFETCGPTGQRIVQLHPSLRCNLRCEHCYSSSGPWIREELDPALVCELVSDAARMGYQVISLSGGEPFLYSGLIKVLQHAKALGLRTTVTTNGYFLESRRLEHLRGCLDILAVSVDGPPELHNRLRGSPKAFDRLCSGLQNLQQSGLTFGFIHTLTCDTWDHLEWVADFAAAHGARLLQLHPLEMVGRADPNLSSLCAPDEALARAYLLAFALAAKYHSSMVIQVDLLHRLHLLEAPSLVYADELIDGWETAPASDLLGLIVLEADGTVVPISYGFARKYQICTLREQSFQEGWQSFLQCGYLEFRRLCRVLFEELITCEQQSLFNWHERVVACSHPEQKTLVHLSGSSAT